MAFVAKDCLVLEVRQAVPRRRIVAALRALAVIELPAGALKGVDIARDRDASRQRGLERPCLVPRKGRKRPVRAPSGAR